MDFDSWLLKVLDISVKDEKWSQIVMTLLYIHLPARSGDWSEPLFVRPGTKIDGWKHTKVRSQKFLLDKHSLVLYRKSCTCGLLRKNSKFPAFAFEPIFGSPWIPEEMTINIDSYKRMIMRRIKLSGYQYLWEQIQRICIRANLRTWGLWCLWRRVYSLTASRCLSNNRSYS